MRRDEREHITHCIIRCRVEVLIGLRVRQFGGRCAAGGISGMDTAFAQEGMRWLTRYVLTRCYPFAVHLFDVPYVSVMRLDRGTPR